MTQIATPPTATRKRARVSIRPIEAIDTAGLSDFYAGLSPLSRARRFLGACHGISESEAARFAAVDHEMEDGYVAVLNEPGPDDGRIVGHGMLTSSPGDRPPEIAFAVADAWQGRGIGTALLRRLLAAAEARGESRAGASLLADNLAMRRLLDRAARPWRITGSDGSVIDVELELQPRLAPRAAIEGAAS